MDALVACLAATLSAERAEREPAERMLRECAYPRHDADGAFGLQLAQVLHTPSVPLALRQAAGIALKAYVHERWSIYFETFMRRAAAAGEASDAAVPPAIKAEIRGLLLASLGDVERKVRLLVSQLLSLIGSCDFPDQFPELLPALQRYLQAYTEQDAHAPAQVHGAIQCLADLVQVELDENQLLIVAREFIPLLQELLSGSFGHVAPHVQARCVLVFRQCLTSLYMAKDTYPDTVQEAIARYLPPWLQAMQALLAPAPLASADWHDAVVWEMLGLRREILRTLSVASRFKSVFAATGPALLGTCLDLLQTLVPLFSQTELEGMLAPPTPPEGDDDVATDVPALAIASFTLLGDTLRAPNMRALLVQGGAGGEGAATDALHALLQLMRTYAQVSCDDEAAWETDADAFIEGDDEDHMGATLRTAAMDLLEQLLEDYPLPVLRVLRIALDTLAHTDRTDAAWWKPLEAQLLLLGSSHEAIEELVEERQDDSLLSIPTMLASVVLPHLAAPAPTLLRGRCFVLASQFASELPPELAQRLFHAALAAIRAPEDEAPLPLKLSAVRAIRNLGQRQPSITAPEAPAVLSLLGALLSHASGSALVLLLDAVEVAVPREAQAMDPATLQLVADAALGTWRHHTNDPSVELSIASLLDALVRCPVRGSGALAVRACMVHALPVLSCTDDVGAPASAAALLRSVLSAAPSDTTALDGVVPVYVPAAAAFLRTSDDPEAVLCIVQGMTTLLQKRADELLAWHDAQGVPALQVLLQVLERLLLLDDESLCGMPLGTLLVTLFVQTGAGLNPVMPALLHALVAKLAAAQTSTCVLALLFPLAYLMAEHTDAVLAQLQSTQLGDASALEVLVRMWLREVGHVHSWFVGNVHLLGLGQLLERGPPLLDEMRVDGDVLPKHEPGIVTRSRAKGGTLERLTQWRNTRRCRPAPR